MAKEIWNKFSLSYKHDNKVWSSDFYSKDWVDAERRVKSMRETLKLEGITDDYLVMEGDNLVFQERIQVLGNDLYRDILEIRESVKECLSSPNKSDNTLVYILSRLEEVLQ